MKTRMKTVTKTITKMRKVVITKTEASLGMTSLVVEIMTKGTTKTEASLGMTSLVVEIMTKGTTTAISATLAMSVSMNRTLKPALRKILRTRPLLQHQS